MPILDRISPGGATGKFSASRYLLIRGSQVRALVRPPSKNPYLPISSRDGGREHNGSRYSQNDGCGLRRSCSGFAPEARSGDLIVGRMGRRPAVSSKTVGGSSAPAYSRGRRTT